MHKKIKISTGLLIGLFIFLSICQAEGETGFVKKTWRKLFNKTEKGSEVENVSAQAEKAPAPVLAEPRTVVPADASDEERPSRKEMIEGIMDNLDLYADELSDRIPAIIIQKGENGRVFFRYKKANGEVVPFQKLSDDELYDVYSKIGSASSILRNERILDQLENIRRIETISRAPQGPTVPGVPRGTNSTAGPNIPRVPSVPRANISER